LAEVVSREPVTVRVPEIAIPDAAEIEPLIVRVPNPLAGFEIRTVAPGPVRRTVDAIPTKPEPAPDVSQFPETVHEPDAVIVPEVPPVIVTLATLTDDVPAVKVAPSRMVRLPPVPMSARFAVTRVALLSRVSVPLQRRPFAAIVKVTAAGGLKRMLWNSETVRLPKDMTCGDPAANTTVPVPADHEVDVDRFVQDPRNVQAPAPKAM